MKKRNWLLFAIMVVIWGSCWPILKVGLNFVDPLNLVMQRLVLASIVLLPTLIWKKRLLPKDSVTWLKMILIGLINATGIVCTNIGLLSETSGLSSILTYTQPLFVFCLAVPFLEEKANLTKVSGVVLGFIGVAILYTGKLTSIISPHAIFYLILGAFLWAVTVVYYKKFLNYVDPAIVNIIQFPLGSIFLLVITLMLKELIVSSSPTYIFSLLYMSVLGSALAMTIWMRLIKEEETIIVSASTLIVPAIALIFGWNFLNENIELYSIIGFIFIATGVYLVNKHH